MYCPSCGTEVALGLNYCNRCGANLSQPSHLSAELPPRQVNLTGPTIAIALMVVIGLGIIFASVSDLARNDFHPVALTWMVVAGLGMIVGVAALVIRQWSHLAGVIKPKEQELPRKKTTGQEPLPAQLPPLRSEPVVPSVTEHTTRTFEPAYIERERRK
jgi:hypothetical protein